MNPNGGDTLEFTCVNCPPFLDDRYGLELSFGPSFHPCEITGVTSTSLSCTTMGFPETVTARRRLLRDVKTKSLRRLEGR